MNKNTTHIAARVVAVAMAVASAMVAVAPVATAAPASPKPVVLTQPDGTTVTVMRHGDESLHWITDLQGNLLEEDAAGFLRPATDAQRVRHEAMLDEAARGIRPMRSVARPHERQATHGNPLMAAPGAKVAIPTTPHQGFITTGQVRCLVLLLQYADVTFTVADPKTHFTRMLSEPGYKENFCYGSVHDYFVDNSNGVFDPQFDVYGPITLSQPRSYYGTNDAVQNDQHPGEMFLEACEQLKDVIDFSLYDTDNDGCLDFMFAFYAGNGENTDGPSSAIWPHAWDITSATGSRHYVNGKLLGAYACTSETSYSKLDGPGAFCHEFLHVLGLKDVYNTSVGSSSTPGRLDIMCSGSYVTPPGAGQGCCPVALNAYERMELGWLQPRVMTAQSLIDLYRPTPDASGTGTLVMADTLRDLQLTGDAIVVPVFSNTDDPRDGEMYVFENRQRHSWDTYFSAHGMLVWHIDYDENAWISNRVNVSNTHPRIDLVEACGNTIYGLDAYAFPGSKNIQAYGSTTTPALLGWDSHIAGSRMTQPLYLDLSDIAEGIDMQDTTMEQPLVTFTMKATGTVALESVAPDTPAATGPRMVCGADGRLVIRTAYGDFRPDGTPLR